MAIRKTSLLLGTILSGAMMFGANSAEAQTSPSPFTTGMRYDGMRRVTGMISSDPDGAGPLPFRAVRNTYDGAGRLTRVETGTLSSWQSEAVAPASWSGFNAVLTRDFTYDAAGRKIKETLTGGGTVHRVTQFSYDSDNRLECTAVRMNPTVFSSLPTSACTLGTASTLYGQDRIVRNVYDAADQLTQVQEGYGTSVQATEVTWTYTQNGKRETLTDAEGNRTTFVYDGHDRLDRMRFPSPTTDGVSSTTDYEQYGYDANNNVTSRRLRDATSIAFTFDNLNRNTFKNLPGTDPDITYAFDLLGRMTGASQTSHALTFTYDGLGRKLTETGPLGTVTSTWDAGGRRTRLTYPGTGLYVDYEYLTTGEMTVIRENGATSGPGVLATFTYDGLGRRTHNNRGNGSLRYTPYDDAGDNWLVQHAFPGAGAASNSQRNFGSRNPAGQITSVNEGNDALAFPYANVNRTDTINGLNQVTNTGGTAVSYGDQRGNITAIGSTTYTYSPENRLISTNTGVTLSYRPLGQLHQISSGSGTTRFLYDGDAMIAEYDGSNNLQRRYVFGPGVDEPLVWYEGTGTTDRRFFNADERGSIMGVNNSSSVPVGTFNRYDEYGNVAGTLNGRFGYTGQAWLPEIAMHYYKARLYNQSLGRFMQTDPVGYQDQVNLYAYVGDDPINMTDPTGRESLWNRIVEWWNTPVPGTRHVEPSDIEMVRPEFAYSTNDVGTLTDQPMTRGEIVSGIAEVAGLFLPAAAVGSAATVGEGAVYAQRAFREAFQATGVAHFRRTLGIEVRTINDLSRAIRSGAVSPRQIPIGVINRGGQQYILNTRSAQALQRAGIPRREWRGVNLTGNRQAESRLTGQLERAQLTPPDGCVAPTGTRICR